MTNPECALRAGLLQIRAGLPRGKRAHVAFLFGGLGGRDLGRGKRRLLFLRYGVHLSLRRWLGRSLVGLTAGPDHLTLNKFVSVGMHPDAIHQRPSIRERLGWNDLGERLLYFLGRMPFGIRRGRRTWLSLKRDGAGETGENEQSDNFCEHIEFVNCISLRGRSEGRSCGSAADNQESVMEVCRRKFLICEATAAMIETRYPSIGKKRQRKIMWISFSREESAPPRRTNQCSLNATD